MVSKTASKGKSFFVCGECGFAYGTENLAHECEDWCRKHHSCSLEITKHAVNLKQ
ncbi:hypothetical protein HYV83_02850 [Candidatus Woesearchaeota archaeon]|nr:hypothetical protein [Candidatus Woesearchaeota archaeon]